MNNHFHLYNIILIVRKGVERSLSLSGSTPIVTTYVYIYNTYIYIDSNIHIYTYTYIHMFSLKPLQYNGWIYQKLKNKYKKQQKRLHSILQYPVNMLFLYILLNLGKVLQFFSSSLLVFHNSTPLTVIQCNFRFVLTECLLNISVPLK